MIDSIVYGLVALLAAIPGVILIILGLDDCDQSNNEITCDLQGSDAGLIAGGVGLILVGVLAVMLWYVRSLGKTGQTIGRKAVGIKVVRSATQQPLGFGAALGRTLFAGVFSSAIFYLGYLWMLWDDKNQTWHDKVVDSIVITT